MFPLHVIQNSIGVCFKYICRRIWHPIDNYKCNYNNIIITITINISINKTGFIHERQYRNSQLATAPLSKFTHLDTMFGFPGRLFQL